MNLEKTSSYRSVERLMQEFVSSNHNFLLVTLPGVGATFMAKLWWQKNKKRCQYITGSGQTLFKKNIIDINLATKDNLEIIDRYFRESDVGTNFLVIVTKPTILKSDDYKESYFGQHIYRQGFLSVLDRSDTQKLVEYYGKGKKINADVVYALSGGLGRLVKFLSLTENELTFSKLIEDEKLIQLVGRVVDQIVGTTQDWLKKIGVVDNKGKMVGQLLEYFFNKHGRIIDISVGNDLTIIEDGVDGNKVARSERDILIKQVENGGFISREQVAEIKWGKKEYSDFSDQALNKSMRRISEKLQRYVVKTIWKTGYQLEKR